MAEIAYVARGFQNPLYAEEMGILDFLQHPDVTLVQALLLKFKPVNMDVLPLYIVLMVCFPPVLWLLLRTRRLPSRVGRALCADLGIRLESAGLSERHWSFNPFAWQLLFVFGAWCALGGAEAGRLIIPASLGVGDRLSCLRLLITMTWYFPRLGTLVPKGLPTISIRSTRPIST